jgi:abortive infection bacteriophage resistance protein
MAAHHDRLLHNKLRVSPANLHLKKIKFLDNKSVYAALTVIHVLLDSIGFDSRFKSRLLELETNYGTEIIQELGFPRNWPAGANGW